MLMLLRLPRLHRTVLCEKMTDLVLKRINGENLCSEIKVKILFALPRI